MVRSQPPVARLRIRRDRPWGAVVSMGLHVGLLLLILIGAVDEFLAVRALGGDGPRGGGGGGGGGGGASDIMFLNLPPAPPAPQVEQMPPAPEETVPLIMASSIASPVDFTSAQRVDTRTADLTKILGVGAGRGGGPGSGTGSGGGIGAGRGAGIGDSIGSGTGGDGGTGIPAKPRQVVLPPFEDVPGDLRNTEIVVTFWVRANGRVSKIEVEPAIRDRRYRRKFRERMMAYRFEPAEDAAGERIASTIAIPIRF